MQIKDRDIYQKAAAILHQLYGANAQFRPGQYEAIEATMQNRRTLVVQRTGWGKSLVYFICTKLLREQKRGVTLVVSPLLVLMENQMEATQKLHLRCDALNSQTKDRQKEILTQLVDGQLDLVFVTPETLFKDEIQEKLSEIAIGMFVVDEAHCISDWGHDFRLEYCRLKQVITYLPSSVKLLATTATANNRVIDDLTEQLGGDVFVSRGPLSRESLWLQVLPLPEKADRYAWILENIGKLPGSGIIYCLTQRDCDYLTDFLVKNGVNARSYYSRNKDTEYLNQEAEESFRRNEIKALVATIKLGMGYDKDDIAFVIHFQMPQNIVSYYQQIGRAGRAIPRAFVFLMSGAEDEDILNYFIDTAFPTEQNMTDILQAIKEEDGVSISQLQAKINLRYKKVEHTISFLANEGYIFKSGSKYYAAPKSFHYDRAHYEGITATRRTEMEQMKQLVRTSQCYTQYICSALDDHTAKPCGHCANCLHKELLPLAVSFEAQQRASEYLNGLLLIIEPRKRWPTADFTGKTVIPYRNQVGICLSKYGDPGFGALVKRDKYSTRRRFCEELIGKSAELLRPILQEQGISYMTCVPSLRSNLVMEFTKQLAERCRVTFVELLEKKASPQQKMMENSFYQCRNAFDSFSVREGVPIPKRILLVDDVVDSRWTLTVCGYRLMEQGCEAVLPYALADSSQKEG